MAGRLHRGSFRATEDPARPKYARDVPLPSGRIHMGHVRNYAMGDIFWPLYAREGFQRAPSDGVGRLRHAGRERRH